MKNSILKLINICLIFFFYNLNAQTGIKLKVEPYTVLGDPHHIKVRFKSYEDFPSPPFNLFVTSAVTFKLPVEVFGGSTCPSNLSPAILEVVKMDPFMDININWSAQRAGSSGSVPYNGYCYIETSRSGGFEYVVSPNDEYDLFYIKVAPGVPLSSFEFFDGVENSGGDQFGTTFDNLLNGEQFTGYELIALPITLSEFKAAWNEGGWVDIKWTTVSEIESDKFLVERSKDGRKWETICTESARGAQDIKMDYFLKDLTPYSGINYYRLKMFDLDGSFKYSPIAAVIVENEGLQAKLYPNPASDFAMIDVEAGLSLTEVTLYNVQGKLIKHQTFTEASQYRVELADIAQGEYFMEILLSDKQIFTKKLILTGNRN